MLTDFGYALRSLRRRPTLCALAVLTLGVGIGSSTALFSVLNAVWLRAIPYDRADRLVSVWSRTEQFPRMAVSDPDLRDWRSRQDVFEHIAGIEFRGSRVKIGEAPQRILTAFVQSELFAALHERPLLGRLLTASDERPDAAAVVLLTHDIWRRRFGGDAGIVGRDLPIAGTGGTMTTATIVGVLPPRFSTVVRGQLVRPFQPTSTTAARGNRLLEVIGLLRPGLSTSAAQQHMHEWAQTLAVRHPETNTGWDVSVLSLRDALVGVDVGRTLLLLAVIVGAVLLVACVNVANLLTAGVWERVREMAIRTSLGATRFRLLRQLLAESLVLSAIATVIAWLTVRTTLGLIIAIAPPHVRGLQDVAIDGVVLLFMLAVMVGAAIASGLVPGWSASIADPLPALLGRRAGHRRRWTSAVLLALQASVGIVVIVVAALFVRSFLRLTQTDLGFNPHGVITLDVTRAASSASPSESTPLAPLVLGELRRLPGVVAAGGVDTLPLSGSRATAMVRVPEATYRRGEEPQLDLRRVTPGYFETMAIPTRSGRTFTDADRPAMPDVVILNDRAADLLWPGQSAIGRRLVLGETAHTVVGVVGGARYEAVERDPAPAVYQPWAQVPNAPPLSFVLRTTDDPTAVLQFLRRTDRPLVPGARVQTVQPFDELVASAVHAPRFRTLLVLALGGIIVVVTVAGIAGLTSMLVARTIREIGIRMAVGARGGQVVTAIVLRMLVPVVCGIAFGLVAANGMARLFQHLFFMVPASDLASYVSATLVLLAVSAFAAYIAARRAARIDPALTLRAE